MSEAKAKDGVDVLAIAMAARMAAVTARYRAGDITLGQWQAQMMADIKASHIAAALAAYGGRSQMNQSKWGTIGQIIRQQYGFQRNFLEDVLSGKQASNGRMDNRARLYATAVRSTFQNIFRRESFDEGMRYERNILDAAESCTQCKAQTDLDWVPIGTLVPIGSRACLSHCKCDIQYADAREVGAA